MKQSNKWFYVLRRALKVLPYVKSWKYWICQNNRNFMSLIYINLYVIRVLRTIFHWAVPFSFFCRCYRSKGDNFDIWLKFYTLFTLFWKVQFRTSLDHGQKIINNSSNIMVNGSNGRGKKWGWQFRGKTKVFHTLQTPTQSIKLNHI